jgi:hypothetical protein
MDNKNAAAYWANRLEKALEVIRTLRDQLRDQSLGDPTDAEVDPLIQRAIEIVAVLDPNGARFRVEDDDE